MTNAINWFELPTGNFDRAVKFYSDILGAEVQVMDMGGTKMGMLPTFSPDGGVGGHLSADEGVKPSKSGALVYLNGGKDLNAVLNRVNSAGGEVIVEKTPAPGGHVGVFIDSEGNRVAVHNL